MPELLREPLRHYAGRVHEHSAGHVHSLTLYGPIATPSFDPTMHAISNVLIVDAVKLETLRRIATEGHRFGKNYITAPLVMTPAFLRGSCDTFPLELIEIQERRIVLFGDDLFAALAFEPAHVRLQCEREIKVMALAMRQAVVAGGESEAALTRATFPILRGMLRVLRGLLWLKELRQPLPAPSILVEVENIAGRHLPGIRRGLELSGSVDWLVFEQLYTDLETLEQIVDGW